MAFDVSGLAAYVEQQNFPLIKKAIFGAKTTKIINKQLGVKGQSTLNLLDVDATWQADGCGFSSSGSARLTQRTITAGRIKADQAFCPVILEGVYAQTQLDPSSDYKDVPFEQFLSDQIVTRNAAQLETLAWQGDTTSGTNNLSYADGFIKVIKTTCSGGSDVYVNGNPTSITAVTAANVLAILDTVYTLIPVTILDKPDVTILVGFDTYRTFTQALKNQNLFNYAVSATVNYEMVLPGTLIKVVAVNGLNSTGAIFAGQLSNFYFGTALEDDSTSLRMWYSMDFQEVRSTLKFRAGFQVAFCSEIVFFQIA